MTADASLAAKGGTLSTRVERTGIALKRIGPLGPAVLLLLLFLAGPILWCVYAAFTNMALTGVGASNASFVGFANFQRMFADPMFRRSVLLTVVFVVGSAVVGQNCLGLLIAILMRGRNKIFRGVIGTAVVVAWVIPEVVAAFVWYAYLSGDGTVNMVLRTFQLPHPGSWLYTFPMLSVILATVWRGTAFSMLVYSAAISDVPPELLEAAAVDGANTTQRLRHVMLPLMKRSIMTNLMLITLQTLSVFTLIFTMTGGGPSGRSQTLPIYMYQQAFKFYQLGFGAAVALILLFIAALFSLAYIRALKMEA